uniref:Uncharacterized protein n=1 Tax=Hemiselmis tepida TaxID=464990 RepID=A0A7S0VR57_9CRYP|mmetsp:Transcript_21220/g.53386  ORF Transcript_21220/g.53386 Transcript_21220/m.53386 type:complete len:368 (+) Transcript_21220:17-1120(+)
MTMTSIGTISLLLLVEVASAFVPAGVRPLRDAQLSVSVASQVPFLARYALAPAMGARRGGRSGAAALRASSMAVDPDQEFDDVAFATIPKDFDPYSKTLDEWFDQLGADTNDERTLAGFAISQQHTDNGQEDEVIERLFGMLTLKEVLHRRAAVQTLGMIGEKILPKTQDLMLTTDCMTTRASCSKVMGAVALRNPSNLKDYPQEALDGMRKAMTEIPDPVTKVASMSALAQIAGGDMANGHEGCQRALDLILDLGRESEDVSVLMSVTNALAAIARTNPQWHETIFDAMEEMQEGKAEVEGFGMVNTIIRTQLMSLSRGARGTKIPPSGDGGDNLFEGWDFGDDDDSEDDEDWDDVATAFSRPAKK